MLFILSRQASITNEYGLLFIHLMEWNSNLLIQFWKLSVLCLLGYTKWLFEILINKIKSKMLYALCAMTNRNGNEGVSQIQFTIMQKKWGEKKKGDINKFAHFAQWCSFWQRLTGFAHSLFEQWRIFIQWPI